jgi:hypothetical protein
MPRLLGGGEARLYSYRIGDPSRPPASRPPAGRPYRAGGLRPVVQHRRAGLCCSHRCVRPVVPLRAGEHAACRAADRVCIGVQDSAAVIAVCGRSCLSRASPHAAYCAAGRPCGRVSLWGVCYKPPY